MVCLICDMAGVSHMRPTASNAPKDVYPTGDMTSNRGSCMASRASSLVRVVVLILRITPSEAEVV